MHTDGQVDGALPAARPCLWPESACAQPEAGVCKQLKPKGTRLPIPTTVSPFLPLTTQARAPVLVLTRISSCKEVTIATTRSIGREERGLLRQSGRLVAGIWQVPWPPWDPSPRGRGLSELGIHPAPFIPRAGALGLTHLVA